MKELRSIYVGEANYVQAMELVDSGRFESFSDLLTYSVRFMCDTAAIYGIRSLPELNRVNLKKVNVRMPHKLVEEMIGLNFCRDAEIYDLALQYYSKIRK